MLENFDELSVGGKVYTIDAQFFHYSIATKHVVLLNYFSGEVKITNCSHCDSKKTCLRVRIHKGCSEKHRTNCSESNMHYGMGHII
jgi:hypothetical protein